MKIRNKILVGLTIVLSLTLALVTTIAFLVYINKPVEVPVVEQPAPVSTTVNVQTPYGDVIYPNSWENMLTAACVSENPYVLRFSGNIAGTDSVPLYDLVFNGEEGAFFASFYNVDGDLVEVRVVVHALNDTAEAVLYRMQQELNNTALALPLSYHEGAKNPADLVQTAPNSGFAIQTPYGTVNYSSYWESYLKVESIEGVPHKLAFWCVMPDKDPVLLYTIVFGEAEGEQVAMINDHPVTVQFSGFIPDETWTEEEQNVVMSLSDEISLTLEALTQLEGMKLIED